MLHWSSVSSTLNAYENAVPKKGHVFLKDFLVLESVLFCPEVIHVPCNIYKVIVSCGRPGLWLFRSVVFWFVAISVNGRYDLLPVYKRLENLIELYCVIPAVKHQTRHECLHDITCRLTVPSSKRESWTICPSNTSWFSKCRTALVLFVNTIVQCLLITKGFRTFLKISSWIFQI